ncbi:hypothetical protein P8T57_06225 [Thalassospira sp. SN3W]|uniref:hypothetical protein n=1 Tax=Thalassospira sp. SN3W TaxID=3035476 RepID=UPI00311AD592
MRFIDEAQMTLAKLWAGTARGTNTGKLFLELSGPDNALVGVLRFNETDRDGVTLYDISGNFDGENLSIVGVHRVETPEDRWNNLTAKGKLSSKGSIDGQWEADEGTGGAFTLFAQDAPSEQQLPDLSMMQLHTSRWRFGAISIDHEQIIRVAENLQQEFKRGNVVVTIVKEGGAEQARFLPAFKLLEFAKNERAEILKISVNEPEPEGTKRLIEIELGPHVNSAMTQSSSEAWTLGRLEKIKNDFKRYERSYATHFKKLNLGANQIIFAGALVYIPSLNNLGQRFIFFVSVFFITRLVTYLHTKYLPFTAIYLSEKSDSLIRRAFPSVVS